MKIKTVVKNGKEWNKKDIQNLLLKNDKAVKRALILIYSFQTETEKSTENTIEENGVGFSGADANILSSFAKQLKTKSYLSPKQLEITRKRIIKYAGQILNYMEVNNS